ncbi:hypothetical protein GF1_26610 [Desulfolithobacter dissulfuricans]|uniref:DUF4382 domain-containing protein n=1 Tax=Desulfolithobacter dissulfuricans TaxID=2795293 RepID=A0A915XJH1_9BACT|nr:DUF4382 domain-containing protein [Desulfolithobacter dissulfuricans]BCO10285.1 hypothetical protein GF1_26610 [Desulfolithobacter dissulfuricans]
MKHQARSAYQLLALFRIPLALLLLLVSCGPPEAGYDSNHPARFQSGGQLSLFLNLRQSEGPAVELTIQAMEVLADNGSWNLVSDRPVTISTRKLRGGQRFLARNYLPQGRYSRLRLTLDQARLGSTTLSLASPSMELPLRGPLYVGPGDSRSLFLTWDVRRSIQNDTTFQPILQVAPRLKHLMADVAYVACPDIDTVFMIRTDKNWVYDSLGVRGEPTYLAPAPLTPRENLYVLTQRDQDIKKVAPSANRVVETYSLPMTGDPVHMALSPDGRWGYIVDRQRGNILRMDMLSGHIDQRVRLGYGPCFVLYLEKTNLVAVSLGMAQTVVLLDPETLSTVRTISTGSRPEGWPCGTTPCSTLPNPEPIQCSSMTWKTTGNAVAFRWDFHPAALLPPAALSTLPTMVPDPCHCSARDSWE